MTGPQYIRWNARREKACQHLRDANAEIRRMQAIIDEMPFQGPLADAQNWSSDAQGCIQGALGLLLTALGSVEPLKPKRERGTT